MGKGVGFWKYRQLQVEAIQLILFSDPRFSQSTTGFVPVQNVVPLE